MPDLYLQVEPSSNDRVLVRWMEEIAPGISRSVLILILPASETLNMRTDLETISRYPPDQRRAAIERFRLLGSYAGPIEPRPGASFGPTDDPAPVQSTHVRPQAEPDNGAPLAPLPCAYNYDLFGDAQ